MLISLLFTYDPRTITRKFSVIVNFFSIGYVKYFLGNEACEI